MSTISALISPSNTTSSNTGSSSTPTSKTLSQQDFLHLLSAEFSNQNPLNSGSSGGGGGGGGASDYVNQLMSLTNLTTMQNISGQQAAMLAQNLPGAVVTLSNNGNTVQGQVQSTGISNNTVTMEVNGSFYPISDLTAVQQSAAQAAASQTKTNSSN